VDFSITQRAHTPTPGIYMGKPTYVIRNSNYDRNSFISKILCVDD